MPSDGSIHLRLTHLPTGMQWLVKGRAGRQRKEVQEELLREAYRRLAADGWLPEEADADGKLS